MDPNNNNDLPAPSTFLPELTLAQVELESVSVAQNKLPPQGEPQIPGQEPLEPMFSLLGEKSLEVPPLDEEKPKDEGNNEVQIFCHYQPHQP
jgi:hypothetical protein